MRPAFESDAVTASLFPIERLHFALPLRELDRLQIVSGIWFLSRHSQLHLNYSTGMLEQRTHPSLSLGQFFYYTDPEGAPAAFCNWAFVSQPVLEDHLATGRDLQPHEFNSGDLPVFYEFLAPFGHAVKVVRDLAVRFKGQRVPAVRGRVSVESGRPPKVQHFRF